MTDEEKAKISPAYPISQLLKAVFGKSDSAQKKVEQWSQVISGILSGKIEVGARAPVSETPGWVTLEVVHGGFSTGAHAAGGDLRPHEVDKAKAMRLPFDMTDRSSIPLVRTALNLHFSNLDETNDLAQQLKSGCYRVQIPEEGALLIVAWLVEHGERERAEQLIEILAPFFDKLRFYAVPHARAARATDGVFIRSAGETVEKLREKRPQVSVMKMNEAIKIWTPLYDRLVRLFLETVEGEIPQFATNADGSLIRAESGQPTITGGWPCKNYSTEWRDQIKKLLEEYESAAAKNTLCKKHLKRKENFAQLRTYAKKILVNPNSLKGREVGIIRKILASYVTAHGAPASVELGQLRADQFRDAHLPLHHLLSKVVADRLKDEDSDQGITNIVDYLGPLTEVEAAVVCQSLQVEIPENIKVKAMKCLEAPVETLVREKVVPSSEVLADLLPAVTANVRSTGIDDEALAQLFSKIYRAFRKRRSLLLLNYESQIRFEELPWISAVENWVSNKGATKNSAREVMLKATSLALAEFPETIFPNKLIRELRALGMAAEISIPWINEIAADIFMGSFSSSFISAAKDAAEVLDGTLYQRYYAIDYKRVAAIDDLKEVATGAKISEKFSALCTELAGLSEFDKDDWSTAQNGAIIEQAQIITSYNLASVTRALNLKEVMQDDFSLLAQKCFQWVCKRLQLPITDRRSLLHLRKNTAYAWRQMVFFISMTSTAEQDKFFAWADEYLAKQRSQFRQRFEPIYADLKSKAVSRETLASSEQPTELPRRYLGWSDMYASSTT